MARSLWSAYMHEFDGTEVVEYDWGFLSYQFQGEVVFMTELYVVPEMRRQGYALKLLAEVEAAGRKAGKRALVSYVRIGTNVTAETAKAHLAVGFVPIETEPGKIWFKRDIVPEE